MGTATVSYSSQQRRIAEILSKQHGIPKDAIYFLNPKKPDEPWLPASALMTIARRSPEVKTISERFDQFIEPLKQVVYVATVILNNDRVFERSGVASLDEKLPEDEEADAHRLAASRAIRNALVAAGIDPMRHPRTPIATFADTRVDDAESRARDLSRIHLLAGQKALTPGKPALIKFVGGCKDASDYKRWLYEQTKQLGRAVDSAGELNQQERACIISALEQLPDAELV